METPRNVSPSADRAPLPVPEPGGLPVPVRRALGGMLLGGTMWLAGLLALLQAVRVTIGW